MCVFIPKITCYEMYLYFRDFNLGITWKYFVMFMVSMVWCARTCCNSIVSLEFGDSWLSRTCGHWVTRWYCVGKCTQVLHGTGIFTYICLKLMVNVGTYSSPMMEHLGTCIYKTHSGILLIGTWRFWLGSLIKNVMILVVTKKLRGKTSQYCP